jgi:hypothetical protein
MIDGVKTSAELFKNLIGNIFYRGEEGSIM